MSDGGSTSEGRSTVESSSAKASESSSKESKRGKRREATWSQRLRRGWLGLMLRPSVWVALFVVAGTWALLPRPIFFAPAVDAGSIATRTYIATETLTVADDEATAALQERARGEVLPVYDFDRELEVRRREQLAALFTTGREIVERETTAPVDEVEEVEEDTATERVARLEAASGLRIDTGLDTLLRERDFPAEWEDRLGGLFARVLRQGVVANKELLLANRVHGITLKELPSEVERLEVDLYGMLAYPDEVRESVLGDLRLWTDLRGGERQILADFLVANVTPTVTPNTGETRLRREAAAEAVGRVTQTYDEGQVLARRGDLIDETTAAAIAEMAGQRELGGRLLAVLGLVLLLCTVVVVLHLSLQHACPRDRKAKRSVSEALLLLTLYLIGCRAGVFLADAIAGALERQPFDAATSYMWAVPWSALALIAALLYGRSTALVLASVGAVLVGRFVGDASWALMLFAFAGSLAAVYAIDRLALRERAVTTRAGVIIGGINVVAVLTLGALGGDFGGSLDRIGFDLVCGLVGGLLAAAVAAFLLPLFESAFAITTHIKLLELANPNRPLLRRLALEAAGTFQHSLAVANLAKAGCEAIGADAVLVNTAALYHDVGKLTRSQYFIENQIPGQNPHDKIQPSMSALILINHIKDGVELARTYGLPPLIVDAIEQHHGTGLIKFFYRRAQDRTDPETAAVREEDFRYLGPKPQRKEWGILLLADGVEAASRTLVEPGQQKIRTMLRQIFDDALGDGQLDQTDLTLGEIRRVEEAFLHILLKIYHRRVDYPGFDFNRKQRGDESGSLTVDERTAALRRRAS
ncbi:MAG: HDIG domain-containing metalloprotein [Acidobacteriota bacterium]